MEATVKGGSEETSNYKMRLRIQETFRLGILHPR